MKIFPNGKKMKYFIHQRPWFLLLLIFPQQEIHIFSRLCLFGSLFLKCKMLKIKGVSISLTEAKYFNVVGILTSQDGPKAIFVIGKREGQTSILPHTFIMHAYSNFILFLTNSLIGIESKRVCIINVRCCTKRESYVVP